MTKRFSSPERSSVWILRWSQASGNCDENDGWMEMDEAGYSFHQAFAHAVEFVKAARLAHVKDLESEDFPSYVPVPQRGPVHGHHIPVFKVQIPFRHEFGRLAQTAPHGAHVERWDRKKRSAERLIKRVDTQVSFIDSQVFWPERRTPELW